MKKVFIINGGQVFAESKGKFNKTLTIWTETFLKENGFDVRVTDINDDFDPRQGAENFAWADTIVLHTPIWWFQLPHKLKEYIDLVFEAGRGTIFKNDGRTRANPETDYGTGGLLQGKNYFITTSWNAPEGAFTLKGELMNETSVDNGVLFGVHIAMKFVGLTKLDSFHFYDVIKGLTPERFETYHNGYHHHLKKIFDLLEAV
ncbi:MAG: NAD(P)H-dependent oxidoreductase [Chitinophagaceae bacterium]